MSKPSASKTTPSASPGAFWRSCFSSERILLGLVLLWTFLALCYPLYDTDFWWHLRTGELILQLGQVPAVDWYTFMDSDKPWIDLHWGFQLLITGLYRLGGPTLVVLAKAIILTAAVGIAFAATGKSLPMWMKVLLWFPAIVAITGRGYERPEMLSQLFLAGWLWIVYQLETKPRLIWLLPAIQVVWINCHALFILGLVVGACYVVDRIVREVAKGRWGLPAAPLEPDIAPILWAGLAAILAALCNPYFEQGALFPLELYRKFSVEQDFYSVRIGEFTRPFDFAREHGAIAFRNIYFLSQLVLWGITTLSFLWLGRHGRWNVMRLLLFAGFSHLAWEATRNTNIFALVAAAVMCANFEEARQLSGQSLLMQSPRRNLAVAAFFAFLSLTVVTGFWNQLGERNKPFGFGEHPGWYVHSACLFAAQDGFPNHAFVAHNGQAGVYIYHCAPFRLVFMDARLEVSSRRTFELYEKVRTSMAQADGQWVELMKRDDKGRLPVVILDALHARPEIEGMLRTRGWRLVYCDPISTVFLDESLAQKLSLSPASIDPLPPPLPRKSK